MAKHKTSIEETTRGVYSSIPEIPDMVAVVVPRTQVDRGRAGVIIFATFFIHIITGGLQQTSGMMRHALQGNISKENLHYVSWFGSIYVGLVSLAGPLSSLMVYKMGCRFTIMIGGLLEVVGFVGSFFIQNEKMYFLTYSITAGLGSGLAYTAAMVVISYNFEKYLALASGISVSGQGVGLLVVSILLNYFFENYGLKTTFLVMASLSLHKLVFGSLLWPSDVEMAQTKRFWLEDDVDENTDVKKQKESCSGIKSYLSLLGNIKFINFLFCIMCFSASEGMVYLMLPGYLIDQGSSANDAVTVLTLAGISSMLTRPLMGFLGNSDAVDIYLLFLAPIGILGMFTFCLPFYAHLNAGRLVYGVIFGFYNCSVYALLNKLTVRIAGIDHLSSAFGIEMFIWGLMGILGTPLADIIVKWSGSASSAFYLSGSLYGISAMAGFLLPMNCQRETTKTVNKETESTKV